MQIKNIKKNTTISAKEVSILREMLHTKIRDLLLFDLIIETGIGLSKLLQLRVKDLLDLKAGDNLPIQIDKTGNCSITMTETICGTFKKFISHTSPKADDYLFKSKKRTTAINLSSASNMVKGWFKAAGLKGAYNTRTLKNTWKTRQKHLPEITQPNLDIVSSKLFKPIKVATAQEIIYQKLSEAIISCKIPPGTRLTTSQIAKAFNVSHAPARVALNWLEARGFIISKKKQASIVKELSIKELKEIMRIRHILEAAALEEACQRITPETIDIAQKCNDAIGRTDSLEEHDKLNTEFHMTIYRDIHMPLLMQMITDLSIRVRPYVILFHSSENQSAGALKENELFHQKIIDALRKKDFAAARKHLDMDLNKATDKIEEILNQRKGNSVINSSFQFHLPSVL
jgi:DNA-binding GntR family transcriptional regulator